MNEIRLGACMTWKPAGGGCSATVTVMALDMEKDRVQVHVKRVSTGGCATHWVDMATLSEGPKDAKPCACFATPQTGGEGDPHAA
jgi:hypothetical protein